MGITAAGQSLKLLGSFFDTKTATKGMLSETEPKCVLPFREPVSPLPEETPENTGVSSAYIESFLRELEGDEDINMHSVMILKDGKIICRAAFGGRIINVPKYTFSACKTVVSLAFGALFDRGIVNPDEKVCDIFDKECPSISKFRSRQITVYQLLTMQSGISFSEIDALTQEGWLEGALGAGIKGEPGKFIYNSINTYLLTAIICRKTGKTLCEVLNEYIFSDLGIVDYFWEKSPDRIKKGGWGLYIKPDDIAKLGQLVMQSGQWNGKQIISKEYLAIASSTQSIAPESYGSFNYGFQMWVGREKNTFLFNGMLGQNVLGFRDSGIILVTNGGDEYNFQQCRYFDIADKYFGGKFLDKIREDKQAHEHLENYIEKISDFSKKAQTPPRERLAFFAGKTFEADDERAASVGLLPNGLQLLENNFTKGFKAFSVSGRYDMLEITYEENGCSNRFPVGIGRPAVVTLTFAGQSYLAAVQGKVTEDEDENPVMKVKIDFLETPFTKIIKIVLKKGYAVLRQWETPGRNYVLKGAKEVAKAQTDKLFVSAALDNLDLDYIEYRVDKVFYPSIRLKIK